MYDDETRQYIDQSFYHLESISCTITLKPCAFTASEMEEAEHEYEAFKQAN